MLYLATRALLDSSDGWGSRQSGRTLTELEGDDWGAPPVDATHVIRRCTELRRIPLQDFGIEDLRLMIAQAISLPILVPIALARLSDDPLAEGDFYPGDLLDQVTKVPDTYWQAHPTQAETLAQIHAARPSAI